MRAELEHEGMRRINARIVPKKKERKYGNVRRRNSSWSEQQKTKKSRTLCGEEVKPVN